MEMMCVETTPVEDHLDTLGLWVKREDLCCPGGPNFSKTRGVFAHVRARNEGVIGVLDTSHSQGGWAVARACQLLGKQCMVYYPEFKKPRGWSPSQEQAYRLGATIHGLPAGRSAVLYHQAKKHLQDGMSYMMPNALKLTETVDETAREVTRTHLSPRTPAVLVSASSGTIASGVLRGLRNRGYAGEFIVHMGYSRPRQAVISYIYKMAGCNLSQGINIVDEGYSYADTARPGPVPPFPCNEFYDLKAFRWWMAEGRARYGRALLWNIG